MTAAVIPFPLDRRAGYIRRQGNRLATMSSKAADGVLDHQLQIQRDALMRKGIDANEAEAQARALESAIRAEVWKLVMSGRSAR